MKKKTTIILGSTLALLIGVGVVSAGTVTSNLSQKIADKFSLNAEDVQKVIDENGGEMHARNGAGMETRLSDLVSEGKITEEQKVAILNKHEEMRNEMDNLSKEERNAKRDEHRVEMKSFFESIGVDSSLFPQNGPRGNRGEGRGMGMHNR